VYKNKHHAFLVHKHNYLFVWRTPFKRQSPMAIRVTTFNGWSNENDPCHFHGVGGQTQADHANCAHYLARQTSRSVLLYLAASRKTDRRWRDTTLSNDGCLPQRSVLRHQKNRFFLESWWQQCDLTQGERRLQKTLTAISSSNKKKILTKVAQYRKTHAYVESCSAQLCRKWAPLKWNRSIPH